MKRTWWVFHRRLGLILLLPLIWWMGTGLVMMIWSFDTIHGNPHRSYSHLEPVKLPADPKYPPGLFKHAQSVRFMSVEGNPVAIAKRASGVEIYDLKTGESLGSVIPEGWAIKAASRDFKHKAEIEKVVLYPKQDGVEAPKEYSGPLPAYGIHFDHKSGMHMYVDGLTGKVRQRRTAKWRLFDFVFELHALNVVPEPLRRVIGLPLTVLWLVLGFTGFVMWRRLWVVSKKAEEKKAERDAGSKPGTGAQPPAEQFD